MKNPKLYKTDGSVVEYVPKNGKFFTKSELGKILGVGGIGFYKLPNSSAVQDQHIPVKRVLIVSKSQKGKMSNKGIHQIYGLPVQTLQGNAVLTDVRWLQKSPF